MWRDAALVAGKDLRVEARSRVGINQVVPFALLVLVVFAFALDSDRDTLIAATALVHGMTIVTRNTADFAGTGAPLIDPWQEPPSSPRGP